MNTQSTRSRNRRRGRRTSGGRRPQSRSQSNSRPPAKPASLWERIVSFFQRESKPASSQNSRPAASSNASNSDNTRANARKTTPSSGGRKPEVVEVTSPRLYVGNLSFDATESDLAELFNGVGSVNSAEVVTHRRTQRSKGFAFVQMQSVDEAKRAVEVLHDQEFMGRKLVVSGAKQPEENSTVSETE